MPVTIRFDSLRFSSVLFPKHYPSTSLNLMSRVPVFHHLLNYVNPKAWGELIAQSFISLIVVHPVFSLYFNVTGSGLASLEELCESESLGRTNNTKIY